MDEDKKGLGEGNNSSQNQNSQGQQGQGYGKEQLSRQGQGQERPDKGFSEQDKQSLGNDNPCLRDSDNNNDNASDLSSDSQLGDIDTSSDGAGLSDSSSDSPQGQGQGGNSTPSLRSSGDSGSSDSGSNSLKDNASGGNQGGSKSSSSRKEDTFGDDLDSNDSFGVENSVDSPQSSSGGNSIPGMSKDDDKKGISSALGGGGTGIVGLGANVLALMAQLAQMLVMLGQMLMWGMIFLTNLVIALISALTAIFGWIVIVIVLVAILIGYVFFSGMFNTNLDGITVNPCIQEMRLASEKLGKDTENAQLLKYKETFSGFLKLQGFNDVQIAGVIGNLVVESGFDPTSIEGIYNEKYIIGERKSAALLDLSSYVENELSSSYSGSGTDYTQNSGYSLEDGSKLPGLGMIQWTGSRGATFWRTAIETNNNWHDFNYQVGYMMAERPQFWAVYKSKTFANASDAAFYVAKHFIGNTTLKVAERKAEAESAHSELSSYNANQSEVAQILSAFLSLGKAATEAEGIKKADISQGCSQYVTDNSSISNLALSYAMPNKESSMSNVTETYRNLVIKHDGNDRWVESCDRAVAVAIRELHDPAFPMGSTTTQDAYLKQQVANGSGKWLDLGYMNTLKITDLRSGDILMVPGHTLMYVDNKDVQKYNFSNTENELRSRGINYGTINRTADSVEASYTVRGAGLTNSTAYYFSRGGTYEQGGIYKVFRPVLGSTPVAGLNP